MDFSQFDIPMRAAPGFGPDSPVEAYSVRRSNRFFAQSLLSLAFGFSACLILWVNFASDETPGYLLLFLFAPIALSLWTTSNFVALRVSFRRQENHNQHPELAKRGLRIMTVFFVGLILAHVALSMAFGRSYPVNVMLISPPALEPILFALVCLGLGYYLFSGLRKVDEAYLMTFSQDEQVMARKMANRLIRQHILIVFGFMIALPIVFLVTLALAG